MLMRQRHQCPATDRGQIRQLDLFGVPAPTGFDQPVPTWRVLPEEIRRVVTELMARLLLDHGHVEHRPHRAEAVEV
jgi:hypothetical protein